MSSSEFQRGHGEVTLYLSRNQRGIIPVPLELQHIIPERLWNDRVQVATKTASRYSKPMLERIWILLALVSIVVLPVIMVPFIARQLYTENHELDGYYFGVARGIGIALFVGTGLLFFLPVFVWKLIGRIQVKRLLQHWVSEDRVMLDQTKFIPVWRIRTPGVFRDSIILRITTPPPMGATAFHPAAYLPSYVTDTPQQPDPAFHNVALTGKGDNPFADFDEKDPGHGDVRNV